MWLEHHALQPSEQNPPKRPAVGEVLVMEIERGFVRFVEKEEGYYAGQARHAISF